MSLEMYKLFGVNRRLIGVVMLLNIIIFSSLYAINEYERPDSVEVFSENTRYMELTHLNGKIYWISNYVKNETHRLSILHEMEDDQITDYILYVEILADGGMYGTHFMGHASIMGVYDGKLFMEFFHYGDLQMNYKFIIEFNNGALRVHGFVFDYTTREQIWRSQINERGDIIMYGSTIINQTTTINTIFHEYYENISFSTHSLIYFNSTNFKLINVEDYANENYTINYEGLNQKMEEVLYLDISRPNSIVNFNHDTQTVNSFKMTDDGKLYVLYTDYKQNGKTGIYTSYLMILDMDHPANKTYIDTNIKADYWEKMFITGQYVSIFTDRQLSNTLYLGNPRSGKLQVVTIDTSKYGTTELQTDTNFAFANRATTLLNNLYNGTDEIQDPQKVDMKHSIITEVNGSLYLHYVAVINDPSKSPKIQDRYGVFCAKIDIAKASQQNITDEVEHNLYYVEGSKDRVGDKRVDVELHAIDVYQEEGKYFFQFFIQVNKESSYLIISRELV